MQLKIKNYKLKIGYRKLKFDNMNKGYIWLG